MADDGKKPEPKLGSAFSKKIVYWVLAVAAIPALVSLGLKADKPSLSGGGRAEAAEGELAVTIPLLGFDQWSRPVSIGEFVPYLWDFSFQGPDGTWVRLAGGAVCSINDWLGVMKGELRFAGPAGHEVKVWVYPPGTLANTLGALGKTCPA